MIVGEGGPLQDRIRMEISQVYLRARQTSVMNINIHEYYNNNNNTGPIDHKQIYRSINIILAFPKWWHRRAKPLMDCRRGSIASIKPSIVSPEKGRK